MTGSSPTPDKRTEHIGVIHAADRHRYELRDGDATIGFSTYHYASGGDQVVFTHTEVDEAYSGLGLAQRLARFALDDVRSRGKRIVPLCPFIASFLRKHHDYDDIVDLPAPTGPAPAGDDEEHR